MTQPKNVQAVLDWVDAHRPDCSETFHRMFSTNLPGSSIEGMICMVLIGFEAGRVFEKANPNVISGIGY